MVTVLSPSCVRVCDNPSTRGGHDVANETHRSYLAFYPEPLSNACQYHCTMSARLFSGVYFTRFFWSHLLILFIRVEVWILLLCVYHSPTIAAYLQRLRCYASTCGGNYDGTVSGLCPCVLYLTSTAFLRGWSSFLCSPRICSLEPQHSNFHCHLLFKSDSDW